MIKVAIVDDQDILKEGLKLILGYEVHIEIVGTGSNGDEAYELCRWQQPDVVLMDIKMPKTNGVEATRRIKKDFPGIKIIVLTTFKDDAFIYDSLKYGASGYLLKDAKPEEISRAIQTVYEGGSLIAPDVASKVLDKFSELATAGDSKGEERPTDERVSQLTDRERDICALLSMGKNNKEIAEALYLSEGTVKNHITHILNKIELRDRTQLAIFAVKNKL